MTAGLTISLPQALEGAVQVIAPPSVHRFCAEHSLVPFLDRSIELAKAVFSVSGRIQLQVESDPDAGDEFIAINVPVRGTAEQLCEGHRRHTRLTRGFPDDARSRLRIMVDPV